MIKSVLGEKSEDAFNFCEAYEEIRRAILRVIMRTGAYAEQR